MAHPVSVDMPYFRQVDRRESLRPFGISQNEGAGCRPILHYIKDMGIEVLSNRAVGAW